MHHLARHQHQPIGHSRYANDGHSPVTMASAIALARLFLREESEDHESGNAVVAPQVDGSWVGVNPGLWIGLI